MADSSGHPGSEPKLKRLPIDLTLREWHALNRYRAARGAASLQQILRELVEAGGLERVVREYGD